MIEVAAYLAIGVVVAIITRARDIIEGRTRQGDYSEVEIVGSVFAWPLVIAAMILVGAARLVWAVIDASGRWVASLMGGKRK